MGALSHIMNGGEWRDRSRAEDGAQAPGGAGDLELKGKNAVHGDRFEGSFSY